MPRRRAVGLLVAGLLGFGLSPKRAIAGGENVNPNLRYQGLKDTPCTNDMCSRGNICGVLSLPNKWNQKGCIKLGCCQGDQFCCAGPATAHGAVGGCCSKGFDCDAGKCICNGTLDFRRGCVCPPERTCGSGCCKQGERCVHDECCPTERVCSSGCCKKGEQCIHGECVVPPECDCSNLKTLQIELRNAIQLQENFRNKIADLRAMNRPTSQNALQVFAKSDALRGHTPVPGYNGPDHVDYFPWGRDLHADADLSQYTNAQLCRMADSAAQVLEEAKQKSACAGIGAATQAHEDFHISFCQRLGYANYEAMHGADRAQEEVEAYGVEIAMLRDILDHLGCG
jgi:hypothetical protein